LTLAKGQLRGSGRPIQGSVTVVVPGEPERTVETNAEGRFRVTLPSHGALVLAATGHEPQAVRVFAHPRVQAALGALIAEREGKLHELLAKPTLFPAWRLLLSELEFNVDLAPLGDLPTPVPAAAEERNP
jgi:hypothetical protein